MPEEKITIQVSEMDANSYIQFQKHYAHFMWLQRHGIFDKDFTGQVVIDVLGGNIKNLKKITNYHLKIDL